MATPTAPHDDDNGPPLAKKPRDSTDGDVDMEKSVSYEDQPSYSENSYKIRISCQPVKSGQWNPWDATRRVLETIATQDPSLRVFPHTAKTTGTEGKPITSLKPTRDTGEKICTYEANVWIPRVGKRNDVYVRISTTLPWPTLAQRLHPTWRSQKMFVQQHYWQNMGEGKVAWVFGASNTFHWRPDVKARLEAIFLQVNPTTALPIPHFRLAAGRPASGFGDKAIDCEAPIIYCDKSSIEKMVELCRLATEQDLIKLVIDDPKHSGLTTDEYRTIISDQNLLLNDARSIPMWGFNNTAKISLLAANLCSPIVKASDGSQLFLSIETTPNTDSGGKLNFLTTATLVEEATAYLNKHLVENPPDPKWVEALLRPDCSALRMNPRFEQTASASNPSDNSYAKSIRSTHTPSLTSNLTHSTKKKKKSASRAAYQVVNYEVSFPAIRSTSRPNSPTPSEKSGGAWSNNSTIQTQISEISQQVKQMNERWEASVSRQTALFESQQQQMVARINEQQQMLREQTANVANMMAMITNLLGRAAAEPPLPSQPTPGTPPTTTSTATPATPQRQQHGAPNPVTPAQTDTPIHQTMPNYQSPTPHHQFQAPPQHYTQHPMHHPYGGYAPMDYTPTPSYWPAMEGVYQGNNPNQTPHAQQHLSRPGP